MGEGGTGGGGTLNGARAGKAAEGSEDWSLTIATSRATFRRQREDQRFRPRLRFIATRLHTASSSLAQVWKGSDLELARRPLHPGPRLRANVAANDLDGRHGLADRRGRGLELLPVDERSTL